MLWSLFCFQMFDSKAELQIHTQVHMREAKPYKCSHCPKSFANSSYLSQHMRIHLGIKPFGPCQYCQRKVRFFIFYLPSVYVLYVMQLLLTTLQKK